MFNKLTYNHNLEKKNLNFVSYIITAYNKRKYLESVFKSLYYEGGSHKREYIIVDDGSNDNTSLVIKNLRAKLPGEIKVIKRGNLGASYSTNEAVRVASGYWIRLLDGDDQVTYKSTSKMLYLANRYKVSSVYGLISNKKNLLPFKFIKQTRDEGLKKFIRNCPANSSAILVSKERYINSGGCNENFISPDQVLFLRLFSLGSAVFLNQIVARLPNVQSMDRLSTQIKRSRYESILALINLCEENPKLEKIYTKLAYRRALSRANNYYRFFTKVRFSKYWVMYLASKLFFPNFYKKHMYESLKVFTDNHIGRPKKWETRASKTSISNIFFRN